MLVGHHPQEGKGREEKRREKKRKEKRRVEKRKEKKRKDEKDDLEDVQGGLALEGERGGHGMGVWQVHAHEDLQGKVDQHLLAAVAGRQVVQKVPL